MESTSAVKVAVVVSMSQTLLCLKMPWQMLVPALSLWLQMLALERTPRLMSLALRHVGATPH